MMQRLEDFAVSLDGLVSIDEAIRMQPNDSKKEIEKAIQKWEEFKKSGDLALARESLIRNLSGSLVFENYRCYEQAIFAYTHAAKSADALGMYELKIKLLTRLIGLSDYCKNPNVIMECVAWSYARIGEYHTKKGNWLIAVDSLIRASDKATSIGIMPFRMTPYLKALQDLEKSGIAMIPM
ncbi:hypothetical protein J4212_02405 [Candidatus Woesearchaeota archaeon]|nr:hypothetical protein [Candidatus Woesearchaeota archaeon]